jgi:uncharacterized OB-fold protein
VFCPSHLIPQEDCPDCRVTVKAMRPTIFAELAAAELRSGTESCRDCDYIFYMPLERCPRCGARNPLHVEAVDLSHAPEPAGSLADLRFRDL